MTTVFRYICYLLSQLLVTACANLQTADLSSSRGETFGVLKERHTLKELRDMHVVKQRTDYSCGAAALATLMTYYFRDPISEQRVRELALAGLSREKKAIKKMTGFSLLDLKRVAIARGYQAAGFKLNFVQLLQLRAPVIVFLNALGYPHFAVLRDIRGGRIYLADPARGNLRLSAARFLREWEHIVFVLGRQGQEYITTYPLMVVSSELYRPELLQTDRLMDIGKRLKDFAVRTRLP
jgi:uncharacterized protein